MRVLRAGSLAETLGINPSTLWRWRRQAGFPKAFRLSSHALGWNEAEIDAWLEERRDAAREELPPKGGSLGGSQAEG